jgi:hypothetical protein
MNYTVVWKPKPLQKLADIWNNASDRTAVTRAANQIDLQLKRDPLRAGEARSGLFRVLIESPLVIHFRVSEADRLVEVVRVHTF